MALNTLLYEIELNVFICNTFLQSGWAIPVGWLAGWYGGAGTSTTKPNFGELLLALWWDQHKSHEYDSGINSQLLVADSGAAETASVAWVDERHER